jgi:carbamoyltransferase
MNIIGIYCGHNATACLLINGKIATAISQEKFDNIKNSEGFPTDAVKWCFNYAIENNLEVNAVGVVGEFGIMPLQDIVTNSSKLKEFIKSLSFRLSTDSLVNKVIYSLREWLLKKSSFKTKKYIRDMLIKIDESLVKNLHFIDHHTCHAFSAYYAMPHKVEEEALILTLDGYGDFLSSTISTVKNGEIKRITENSWKHSLGDIYTLTTKFLGMKMMEHEYKVMGLAPYAKEYYKKTYERIFKGVLNLDSKNNLLFKSKFPTQGFYKYLCKNAVGERFDNIAGALQYMTEDLVTRWIESAVKATGIKKVYFSGGVFMNVKVNMKIAQLGCVDEVYFLPSAGDESTPFGAAFYLYKQLTKNNPKPIDDIYFGMEYSDQEVKDFLDKKEFSKYKIEYCENIEKKVAELLSNFNVVARVSGRAEWGARSLGNRSILANPSDMKSFYEVNDQIKCRDFWMPFAPSILDIDSDKYIKNPKKIDAPYMILAFESTEIGKEKLRAAMHQGDHTLRPQIVKENVNKNYYNLISEFRNLTGIGAVMNTSLNLHGYPMVATLEQAMFTFENSGLKYIAIENFLVSKNES